jgi:hypothetical protein
MFPVVRPGPQLFSIHIKKIEHKVYLLIALLLKFADNTKLGQIITSQQASARLQECQDRLMERAVRKGLAFK